MSKVYLEIVKEGIDWCSKSISCGYIGIDKEYIKGIDGYYVELTDEGIKVAEELSGIAPLKGYIPYHFTLVKNYEIEPIIAKYKKKIKVLKKQLKSLGIEQF